jgi:ComF family protein
MDALPATNFEWYEENPVAKRFYGRLPLLNATAQYYFTKESLLQYLIHQLKYKGNRELGIQLGRMMGDALKSSGKFDADIMIPLPLFPEKEEKRGYNQSTVLCEGIAEFLNIPVLENIITRPRFTETQTKKGRIERWKNMEGKFHLKAPGDIRGKHILLVDDVITTGATLEACGMELLGAGNVHLSIAVLCHAG